MLKCLTNSTWLRKLKSEIHLSDQQRAVLIGTLLGDGYLRLSKSGKAARLQICHSVKAKDYLLWMYDVFSNFIYNAPDFQSKNHALRFTTISHQDFIFYRTLFYSNRIKTIPQNIDQVLTYPLSPAVWFMDDGNGYLHSNGLRISTYAFGLIGNQRLQKCLQSNFGLSTNLLHDQKGYQLYFPVENSASKFKQLISPYIIPSMKYKIEHRSPVETYMVDVGSKSEIISPLNVDAPDISGDEDIVHASWKHEE